MDSKTDWKLSEMWLLLKSCDQHHKVHCKASHCGEGSILEPIEFNSFMNGLDDEKVPTLHKMIEKKKKVADISEGCVVI